MFKKLVSAIEQFGMVSGLLYLLDQAFIRSGSRFRIIFYELVKQPVAPQPAVPEHRARSTTIREIHPGDPLLSSMPPPPHIIQNRFAQNAVCLGAFLKQELVGYLWLCLGPYDEDEVRCTFVPTPANEAAFDFDIFVFPDFRLGRAFSALWEGANRYMSERGVRYTCSRISRFNLASRKAHRHLGARRVGRSIFFVGKKLQIMLTTGSPYVHLSFNNESRPRLLFKDPE